MAEKTRVESEKLIQLLERKKALLLKGAKSTAPGFEFGGGAPAGKRIGAEVTGAVGATGDFAKKDIFPRLTTEEALKSPLAAAGAKTGRELVSVPANFFNQLLLNAPRSLVEGSGFEFPSETDRPLTQALGKAAGIAGAIKSPIIKGAQAIARATKAPRIAQAAVEGGIIGGAVSPEDFTDVKQRIGQAAGGAVIGAGLGAIGAGARGAKGLFRKGVGKFKEARAGKLASDDIVGLRRDIQDATAQLKSTVETTKTKAGALQKKVLAEKTLLEDQIQDDVAREAGKLSVKTQSAARAFIKKNSEIYGKRLDAIDESLTAEQQNAFTADNIISIVERTTDEASEALITEGAGINALNKISELFSSGLGGKGLKALLNVVKAAKQSVSAGAKAGREGFTADDIPIEIFRKNVGLFLESIGVDDVAQLNKGYSPVMELTKKVNAVFKPFKGALETGTGEQVFRRVLAGKPQLASEKALITRLKTGEKGFAKGIGEIDKSAKAAITSLRNRVKQLEGRRQKVTAIEKKNIVSETKKIATAISQKKLDIRKLQDIVRSGKDATDFLKKAGIGVAALSGTGLVGFATKKILSGFKRTKK